MPKQPRVSSREYKSMLDHRLFAAPKTAAAGLWREVAALAQQCGVRSTGDFSRRNRREIMFLDTVDFSIRLNGFILRRRFDSERRSAEYTLKCRSPDRYVAAGASVEPRKLQKLKLEEDIAAPFVVRYSHSGTTLGKRRPPATLAAAAKLFPALAQLQRDGAPIAAETSLQPVNALNACECVLEGPTFQLADAKAEVALILWTEGAKGRPLVAEFSFRYKSAGEEFSAESARVAMRLFEKLQRVNWFLPEAQTKTRFVYGEP